MCSICGVYNFKKEDGSEYFIKNAFSLMQHRGPDDSTYKNYDQGKLLLGHQRLSIIDTRSISNQPMESDLSSLIFNGEIYNYKELKENELKNVTFVTDSDTEVLQKGLEKYGLPFLNKCNGMFAFAFFDKTKNNLLLARDRFGVKPLHYMIQDEIFYFSSEIQPLIKVKKSLQPNLKIYKSFIKDLATDYNKETFVEGVYSLEKGHALVHNKGNVEIKQWYLGSDFKFDEGIFKSKEKTIEFTEELLANAISIRLRSDVPLCITLSGGIDSTTIYTLIKEKLHQPITPFVFSHKGSNTDETSKVERLVQDYEDELQYVESNHDQGVIDLEKALEAAEFPIWNYSGVAYMDMYESISKAGIKVIVEGHGSDEQLGGYTYIIQAAVSELIKKGSWIQAWKVAQVLKHTENAALGKKRPLRAIFKAAFKELFRPDSARNNMQICLDEAFNYKILPIVLRTFDRITMRHTLESRSPFMDYRIVEFFKKLPINYKVNSIGSKAILREILKKYNKDFIYKDKRKMGFASDIKKLLENNQNYTYIKKQVEEFNMKEFEEDKKEALEAIRKDIRNHPSIWKIASLNMTNKKYGFN